MIWVAKGGRPCKNKPDLETLKLESAFMSVQQLMDKYGVSQATMYRYIKEAREGSSKQVEYTSASNLTFEQLQAENEALKSRIGRLEQYISLLEKKVIE